QKQAEALIFKKESPPSIPGMPEQAEDPFHSEGDFLPDLVEPLIYFLEPPDFPLGMHDALLLSRIFKASFFKPLPTKNI
ncbi:hypothetical protein HYS48_02600, partial [Candidatus Woesearchaeota archaeon]|nr:hypothetical protein [Candidatus Woesearchaeota archaeon]